MASLYSKDPTALSGRETIHSRAPATHDAHAFHSGDRDWPETNCYVDVWIEVLQGHGLDVAPLFPFTLASDFEGDQWTFYKPPQRDLFRLYGIEVEELNLWRSLDEHCTEQVSGGRIPLVEMDSFYLPDTRGRGYRETHVKTTIGITQIDRRNETLVYFHNRGLYELEGADFRGLFRIDPAPDPSNLLPYAEIVKFDRLVHRDQDDLRNITLDLVRDHLSRRPPTNPIRRYSEVVEEQLSRLIDEGPETYDDYTFACIRQCGSCFGFSADVLEWLAQGDERWSGTAAPFARISSIASMLVMKMARIVHSGRLRSLEESFAEMADALDGGMNEIEKRIAP